MSGTVSNARSGRFPRAAWIAVPAVLSMLMLGGVTARPVLDLTDAHAARSQAIEREARWRAARAEHDALTAADAGPRLASALQQLRGYIPTALGPLEAHTLLRVVAADSDIVLTSLQVGEPRDVGLAGSSDRIEALEARLGGSCSPAALVRFVDRVHALGQPCSVRELALQRESADERTFDVRLCLLLYVSRPIAASNATSDE
ncbi:MAG: hypothetical protein HZA52_10910 [Planctomycetes bacterium]|nr:hypothetical protein [Planctomycetota bacterium]